MRLHPRSVLALLGVLAAALLFVPVGSASATTALGFWWTAHQFTSCTNSQAQYENRSDTGGLLTRGSGWAVTMVSGCGYVSQVKEEEWCAPNPIQGTRTINYTGSATQVVEQDIPTSYMPSLRNNGACEARETVTTTLGNVWTQTFDIGR